VMGQGRPARGREADVDGGAEAVAADAREGAAPAPAAIVFALSAAPKLHTNAACLVTR